MKKCLKVVLIVLSVALFVLLLTGCSDRYDLPKGFVNAEKLRIEGLDEDGKIKLSPTGQTAEYQLNVIVLPENANRQLKYFVPTQYSQYIQVTETGLIIAKTETPEDIDGVPLTITSATNSKATLTVMVVVETVAVKDISFESSSISLLYNGDSYQITPIFRPAHALDGREVTYTSINPAVATVSSTGLVTPVSAGHTHISVESRTSGGITVKSLLNVEVMYEKGEYRLESSDARPQYNQILGNFMPINFTVLSLNPHSDPDFRVYWYVGARFMQDASGRQQYSHTPNVNTTTSYRIRVIIREKDQSDLELQSELITIYNVFTGFSLGLDNLSSARDYGAFQYGDEVTFRIIESLSSIDTYQWYLKKYAEPGLGVFVGETLASSRDLTRRLNIEGDYILTVHGLSREGELMREYTFQFGVTRFNVGDRLIIDPTVNRNGMPPESYNFYIYNCGGLETKVGTSEFIGSAVQGDKFVYDLTEAGNYIIECSAMLDGLIASVDGTDFYTETPVIRVFGEEDYEHDNDIVKPGMEGSYLPENINKVNNIVIEGIKSGDEYRALVVWDPVIGMPEYFAEVADSDGNVYFLDSEGADSAAFGSHYLIIPSEYVDLQKPFTVRIRQKGSLFGPTAAYVEERIIPENMYGYLDAVEENSVDNLYFTSIRELGNVLNYIEATRPNRNSVIDYEVESSADGTRQNFMFDAFFAFDFEEALTNYPTDVLIDVGDEDLQNVFKALLGAQSAYMPNGNYEFGAQPRSDGGYRITISIMVGATSELQTPTIEFTPGSSDNYSSEPYGLGNRDFAINYRTQKTVRTVEQLYWAVENGYRPNIINDVALSVYTRAQEVVNSIIGKGMTDEEKVVAIFDWLTTNVAYDVNLAEMGNVPDAYRYSGYTVKGVFGDRKAVCDGIAKAFVLLCGIEGIPAYRVVGATNGTYHAWNKAYIDGEWYIFDATNGSFMQDGTLYTNHKFVFLSDEDYQAMFAEISELGEYPACETTVNYYSRFGYYAENTEDLGEILAKIETVADIKISDDFFPTDDVAVTDGELRLAMAAAGLEYQYEAIVISDNRIIVKRIG